MKGSEASTKKELKAINRNLNMFFHDKYFWRMPFMGNMTQAKNCFAMLSC